jgi:hypothetical protein
LKTATEEQAMKVTAPLFSLDASGSLGGAIVASKWKGRNYMRRLVIPANPRSGGQTANRAIVGFLAQIWAGLSAPDQATWNDLAAQGNFSAFNALVRYDAKRWTQFAYPTRLLPIVEAGFGGTVNVVTVTGEVGQASGSFTNTVAGANPWGYVCAVNVDNDELFVKSDVRLFGLSTGADTPVFVLTNMTPGTYYAKVARFDKYGNRGAIVKSAAFVVT